jgi:hypothetical protein
LLLGSLLLRWLTPGAGGDGEDGVVVERGEPDVGKTQPKRNLWQRFGASLKRNAQIILALLSSAAIATAGFLTQFAANDSFNGSPGSFMTLFLWTAGVQLAGTAVVDIVKGRSP